MSTIESSLKAAMRAVTKEFTAEKRKTARQQRLSDRAYTRLTYRVREKSVKEAAFDVMKEAYMKASADNTLPAKARQIMYAARPLVQALTDKTFQSNYLQGLILDYMEDYPRKTANWNVAFDARGHLSEPHTKERVPLGTLEVRSYVNRWTGDEILDEESSKFFVEHDVETIGPSHRYKQVLFVEKEGFNDLWKSVKLKERYDMPIMSTKGMSTTAARELVERLSEQGVTIFVMHDFDKSGFSILNTLRSDTPRYQYSTKPKVVDLGLRLADIEGLQREEVRYRSRKNPKWNLRENGATKAEIDVLVTESSGYSWFGERVELNAMDSKQLVEWVERKLKAHGVKKLIPNKKVLKHQYSIAHKIAHLNNEIQHVLESYKGDVEIPDNLKDLVTKELETNRSLPWEEAVWNLLEED